MPRSHSSGPLSVPPRPRHRPQLPPRHRPRCRPRPRPPLSCGIENARERPASGALSVPLLPVGLSAATRCRAGSRTRGTGPDPERFPSRISASSVGRLPCRAGSVVCANEPGPELFPVPLIPCPSPAAMRDRKRARARRVRSVYRPASAGWSRQTAAFWSQPRRAGIAPHVRRVLVEPSVRAPPSVRDQKGPAGWAAGCVFDPGREVAGRAGSERDRRRGWGERF